MGKTDWHVVAERVNIAVLEKHQEWVEENLTEEDIKDKFLFLEGCMGKSDYQLTTKERKLDSVRYK